MSGIVWLDWMDLSVSLFNTALLVWLGMTILLNAERRTWGITLAGGGMLAGGVFFISHTALLGHGTAVLTPGLEFWWRTGWVPVVLLPFAWYVLILWYSGCWEGKDQHLWKRHRIGFAVSALLLVGLAGLLLANSLPSMAQFAQYNLSSGLQMAGIPVFIVVYPVYTLTCMLLSIDALRNPVPSSRLMGDRARRRAHPWMIRASFVFLVVGILVGGVLYWVIETIGQGFGMWDLRTDRMIAVFDLVISGCISGAIILLGQAITEYEIFTGKSLPRRGLSQLWRRTLILAAGYSLLMGWSLVIQLRPIYSLLLGALLLAAFLAVLGWRQYTERERLINHLRPILSRQRLYDRSLRPGDVDPEAVQNLFNSLCEQVFGVRKAFLIPLGSMATLVEAPVTYPGQAGGIDVPGWQAVLLDNPVSPGSTGFPCPAHRGQEDTWITPLWNDKGLAGMLVLGEKSDGGLYTQEEIEVAQAAGEQILDSMAIAELARRLIRFQRQQMAESQVYDRRLRRALHDDFLPQVHEILLAVDSLEGLQEGTKEPVLNALSDLHRQISNLLRGLKTHHAPEVNRVGVVEALRRVVEDELEGAFREVKWIVPPTVEERIRCLSPVTAEVIYYAAREAVRNAAAHGAAHGGVHAVACAAAQADGPEDRLPALTVSAVSGRNLEIHIEDDAGRRIQASGDEKGTGQGLVLHSTMMSIVGGSLRFDRVEGQYWRVILEVPDGINS